MSKARKALASLLTGVVTWGSAVVVSEPTSITAAEWMTLAGVGVASFFVWFVTNDPAPAPA